MTGLGSDRICFLYVQHIQTGNSICADIAAMPLYVHISPAAEGFVACSGQNHYIDILALAAVIQGVADFRSGGGGERVAVTRTVDGDFRYSVVKSQTEYLDIL